MKSFVVVVRQIFIDCLLVTFRIAVDPVQTFILKRSVEPFNVSVVIFLPYPAVAMRSAQLLFQMFGKLGRKFLSVVRLYHPELERSHSHCFFHEFQAVMGVNSHAHFSIRPSGSKIDEGVDIKSSVTNEKVNRIDLH